MSTAIPSGPHFAGGERSPTQQIKAQEPGPRNVVEIYATDLGGGRVIRLYDRTMSDISLLCQDFDGVYRVGGDKKVWINPDKIMTVAEVQE